MLRRFAVSFLLFFAGCNSFNTTYELHPGTHAVTSTKTITVSGLKETVPATNVDIKIIKTPPVVQESPRPAVREVAPKGWCPAYQMPKLPPEPVAPEEKLRTMNAKDVSAIEALSAAHIVELHNYIRRAQETLDKSYKDYVTECERAHRKIKM